MKDQTKKWLYDTLCHRCNKLNTWLLKEDNVNVDLDITHHKIYHDEHPFDIKYCEHCKMNTRQEWVGCYEDN